MFLTGSFVCVRLCFVHHLTPRWMEHIVIACNRNMAWFYQEIAAWPRQFDVCFGKNEFLWREMVIFSEFSSKNQFSLKIVSNCRVILHITQKTTTITHLCYSFSFVAVPHCVLCFLLCFLLPRHPHYLHPSPFSWIYSCVFFCVFCNFNPNKKTMTLINRNY